jgi:CBS domain-containing protein
MLRVRDIMTKDVLTLSPDMTVREAMEELTARHVSGAPVLLGHQVVGVVTASDLMAFAATLPGAPAEHEESPEWGEWERVLEEEQEKQEEDLPAAAYFTKLWEDAGADVALRISNVEAPEWNVLDEHTVEEVMTRAPIWKISPDMPVTAAAQYMKDHGIHRVLVMEGDKLVGIVTTSDIARAVAEHKLTSRTYVFEPDKGSRFHPRGWSKE